MLKLLDVQARSSAMELGFGVLLPGLELGLPSHWPIVIYIKFWPPEG